MTPYHITQVEARFDKETEQFYIKNIKNLGDIDLDGESMKDFAIYLDKHKDEMIELIPEIYEKKFYEVNPIFDDYGSTTNFVSVLLESYTHNETTSKMNIVFGRIIIVSKDFPNLDNNTIIQYLSLRSLNSVYITLNNKIKLFNEMEYDLGMY